MKNTKKLLSLSLALIMIVSLLPATAVSAQAAEPTGYWSDYVSPVVPHLDTDTNTYIYTISTASELAWVAKLTQDTYVSNRMFILDADIDLSEHFWVPIGTSLKYFGNTFDGKGYTISNMTIGTASTPSDLAEVGLFGYANGATIRDVHMTNVSINSTVETFLCAGGLAGKAFDCTISGCSVEGQISGISATYTFDNGGIGGIIGYSTSNLSNCSSSVIIEAGGSGMPAGGLVGFSKDCIIESCFATGSVSGAGARYAGGLIGFANGLIIGGNYGVGGSVVGSYATANVSGGDGSYVGGLIGDSYFNVESCFALGTVTGGTAGGLIGLGRVGTVKNSFAVGNISATGSVGGLVGMSLYDGLSSIINCYASGNIETTQTSSVNQHIGGLVGYFNTQAGTVITNAYWNSDAIQKVAGAELAADKKMGIDRTPGVSTARSWDEMTDVAFAKLLNANKGDSRGWTSVYGINGGYPYLEDLYFTTPVLTYDVEFFLSNDDVYKIIKVEQGGIVIAPATDPTKDRYDFMGWYSTSDGTGEAFDFSDTIMSDTSIYAKWSAKATYSVAYHANGGKGTAPEDAKEYIEGESLTLPSGTGLSKENTVFTGWTLSNDGTGTVYNADSSYTMGFANVVFYAKWAPTYTVSYDISGGTGTAPEDAKEYIEGESLTLPSDTGFSKENAVFVGWTLSSDGSGRFYTAGESYTMDAGNAVFYAKWLPTYTVTYDLNDGRGTVPVDERRYAQGDIVLLPYGDDLTNGDLKFGGWVDRDGNVYDPEYDYYEMGNADVTFYAKWTNYWTDFIDIEEDEPQWDEDSNTFTIDNASELAWVAYIVNSGGLYNFEDANIRISDRIDVLDLSAHEWVPIGSYGEYFSGDFDGNYRKIINLNIGAAEAPDTEFMDAGLFGRVESANISNVSLENVAIFSSISSTFEKKKKKGADGTVGSLAGHAVNSRITNSYASGSISSDGGETSIGGLLGHSYESEILDCHAAVDVTGGDYSFAGGLLGHSEYSRLSESYATGNVRGGNPAAVGGLVGHDNQGILENNYAAVDVAGGDEVPVGGFIGASLDTAISFGYWNSDANHTINGEVVSSKSGIGFIVDEYSGEDLTSAKTAAEMKSVDFAELLNENRSEEMSSTWEILSSANNSYPVLANAVSFNKNGGDIDAIPSSKIIALGQNLGTLPTAPVRNGYRFGGWYEEPECSNLFNSVIPISANTTLYAKWTKNTPTSGNDSSPTPPQYPVMDKNQGTQVGGQMNLSSEHAKAGDTINITVTPDRGYENGIPTVRDENGNPVAVTDHGNGTFSFQMPSGAVTVDTKFTRTNYFDDVKEKDWFREAAWFCAANGLIQGTGHRQFGGNTGTDRAMLVTVLYRLAKGTDSLENIFTDVEDGKWYSEAIAWAAHNNIAEGYGNGKFGPEDMLTREQMVTILHRYAEFMKYDLSNNNELQGFRDMGDISPWALKGMQWAVGNGIVEGMGSDIISPNSGATRAQFAVMMQRFCTNFAK